MEDRPSLCPFAGAAELPPDFEAIVDSALEPFVSLDGEGRVIAWNAQAMRTFGWSYAEAIGAHAAELIVPHELRARHRAGIERYRATSRSNLVGRRVRLPALRNDDTRLWVELRVGVITAVDGTRTYHAFIHDITEIERVRADAVMQNALLSESQRVAHLGSYEHDVRSDVVRCSDELLSIVGLTPDDFDGSVDALVACIHPDDRDDATRRYLEALRSGTSYELEHRIRRPSGEVRIVRRLGYVTLGPGGRATRSFATVQDVTEQREARAALDAANERLRRSVEDAPTGMALANADVGARAIGRFREVNVALSRITGYAREALLRMSITDLIDTADARAVTGAIEDLLSGRTVLVEMEARYAQEGGSVRWLRLHVSLVDERAGGPSGAYAIFQIVDITSAKRAEERLKYLADHDPLTGLLNRRGLEASVRESDLATSSSALFLIDLDYFKYVNDTKGHAIGDRLLKAVALTLEHSIGPRDFVARLGGDEFIVVLGGVDGPTALAKADALRAEISIGIERLSRSGLHVSASVGIAISEAGFEHGLDDVLSAADTALAQAKEGGRNRSALSNSNVGGRETMRERLDWAQRIRSALRDGSFALFRQPILDLATNRIDRYELLVRMIDCDGGVISPNNFLREADRFGLMADIDAWVVGEAIRICGVDARAGRFLAYEVNLSGASLSREGMADALASQIARSGIDPRRLIFEITETIAIANMERASLLATKLRALGCEFALDDFGAGFSSFYYLKRLPFEYLKIDGEFIENLPADPVDQHIVRSIVALARGLGKKTIAEFVTDARTIDLLVELGVDHAQGYYVGRPEAFVTHDALGG